jgi:uncharacterized protein (DUF1810 family)
MPDRKSGARTILTNTPHNLDRFTKAQEPVYSNVLSELKNGRKDTHWMWFIFPQIEGLGHSETARFYAIKSLDEAQQYLNHPVLGARLTECSEIVLGVEDHSIEDIFGFPDHLKFRSCMTLFSCVTNADPVFNAVLDQFFEGKPDNRTLELLGMR